jgi:outer membrane protein OmpA-like peptidoglycan-associated protein
MINTLSIHRLSSLFFISWLLLFVQDAVLAQTALVNVVVLIKDKEDNTFPKEVQLKMKDLKTGKEFTPIFNKADNSFSIRVAPETTVSIYGTAMDYTDASMNIHDIKYDRRVELLLSKIKKAKLKISVVDLADAQPISTATVKVMYKTPQTSTQTYSLKKGVLQFDIFDGPHVIELVATAQGYTSVSKTMTIETTTGAGKEYEFSAKLERVRTPEPVVSAPEKKIIPEKKIESTPFGKLEKGKVITLSNIYFDQSSAILKPESSVELDALAESLQQNASTRVEIRGHTDNVGDFDLNVKLSRERCQSVVDYLIKKGISTDRLQIVGRGPIDSVAPNTTEENRKKNRRVELVVL